jgi:putative exporter of polyketide antibiotics
MKEMMKWMIMIEKLLNTNRDINKTNIKNKSKIKRTRTKKMKTMMMLNLLMEKKMMSKWTKTK